MWEIGRTPYIRSAGVNVLIFDDTSAANKRLRCVSITPFGRPVVPEV